VGPDPVIHIGENSPEEVAFKLFMLIQSHEGNKARNRKELLDLYAECLRTVRNPGGCGHPSAGS
jgi:hypothetical protein